MNHPRKQIFLLLIFSVLLITFGCRQKKDEVQVEKKQPKPNNEVIKKILRNRKLVATTDYTSTNYFIYRGEPMGYQYELLKAFADYLNVKLELEIINDIDNSIECLNKDKCHILAIGLTVTKERGTEVDLTDPLTKTRQMLIQRLPENWRSMKTRDQINSQLIRDPIDLAGKTVHIQKNTTYKVRLQNLSAEIGEDINVVEHPRATTEELIAMVSNGDIDFTICDEHIALVHQKFYPDIDVKTPISFSQNIAWAVKKGADGLRDTINAWLREFNNTRTSAYIYNKYFKNPRSRNIARSDYFTLNSGNISPFDDYIKKYSVQIGWDWRLLASLIYQESRFKVDAKSWAGAYGLMQLMPHNAEKYGIDSTSVPEEQIRAGVEFLRLLDKQFEDIIEDDQERIKFVLAAYNAGIAHVYDARRLAEKYKKDPNKWEAHVDFFLLHKSKPEFYNDSVVKYGYCRGTEPYNFVNEILERYELYKNVVQ